MSSVSPSAVPWQLRSFQGGGAARGLLDVSLGELGAMDAAQLDALAFGVIGLSPADGTTEIYNATESRMAGLSREAVVGRPFFLSVGVCMNNFLVAQRFEDEDELDAVVDYVLTFRMRPTPARLRLLKGPQARHRVLLVQR